jgi:hypothetical protein
MHKWVNPCKQQNENRGQVLRFNFDYIVFTSKVFNIPICNNPKTLSDFTCYWNTLGLFVAVLFAFCFLFLAIFIPIDQSLIWFWLHKDWFSNCGVFWGNTVMIAFGLKDWSIGMKMAKNKKQKANKTATNRPRVFQ